MIALVATLKESASLGQTIKSRIFLAVHRVGNKNPRVDLVRTGKTELIRPVTFYYHILLLKSVISGGTKAVSEL